MLHLIARVLLVAFALLLSAKVIPGITLSGFYSAVAVAVVLGIFNITIKPVLLLLTLPITILTFGLFAFVLNALLFWFVATFVPGFSVAGFVPALFGALLVSIASWFSHRFLS